jgi:thiol-disulfide isomerase/thioredoxin
MAGGAGLGWWRQRVPVLPSDIDVGDAGAGALWGLQFDRPGGGSLPMAQFKGKALLVNFWATWCPPCVEELPLLERFHQNASGKSLQIVGLAIDQPSSVAKFLQKTPLSFSLGLAGLDGTELSRTLGNTVGGLPFTVVFGADGRLIGRKMGQITTEELAKWSQAR